MEMTASERIRAVISGSDYDRLPVIEWAPWWNLTLDRWYSEGLGLNGGPSRDNVEIQRYFGLDGVAQYCIGNRKPDCPQPAHFGAPIMSDEAEYEKLIPYLYPEPDADYFSDELSYCNELKSRGDTSIFLTLDGFFWFPRTLFGIEGHLYSFYDYPDLLARICEDYVNWMEKVIDIVSDKCRFDFMSFAEDMSYNNGPMIGKDTFDSFLAPYYKRIIPKLKQAGIPVFIDSDGDITKAVDWYASVGADGMFPLERKAGVDVSEYIVKQPQMTFLGHFDKMCMKFGEEAMRSEFERLMPSMKKGKLIPSVDHQTPPDVSLDNYRIYVSLLNEYARKVKE